MPKTTNKTAVSRTLRRAAVHLSSRAEWIRRKREPDPRLRAVQLADAAECERLAGALQAMIEGVE
jgi:hypothetical protein